MVIANLGQEGGIMADRFEEKCLPENLDRPREIPPFEEGIASVTAETEALERGAFKKTAERADKGGTDGKEHIGGDPHAGTQEKDTDNERERGGWVVNRGHGGIVPEKEGSRQDARVTSCGRQWAAPLCERVALAHFFSGHET